MGTLCPLFLFLDANTFYLYRMISADLYALHSGNSKPSLILRILLFWEQTQHDAWAKLICTDNGHDFPVHQLQVSNEIIHQKSYIESPLQNHRIERKHRHILMQITFSYSKKKLSYALTRVNYIINQSLVHNCIL